MDSVKSTRSCSTSVIRYPSENKDSIYDIKMIMGRCSIGNVSKMHGSIMTMLALFDSIYTLEQTTCQSSTLFSRLRENIENAFRFVVFKIMWNNLGNLV